LIDVIFLVKVLQDFLILYLPKFFSIYIKQYYFQVMKYYIRPNPSKITLDWAHARSGWAKSSQS